MQFLRKLQPKSLTAKINSGFLLLLAVTLFSAAITIWSITQISNATDQNQRAASTLIELNNLTSASSKLLLTNEEEHYNAGIKAADAINQQLANINDSKTATARQNIKEFRSTLVNYNASLKNRNEKTAQLYRDFDTIDSGANEATRETTEAIAVSTEMAEKLKAETLAAQQVFENTVNIARASKDMQIYALRYANTKSSNFLKRIERLETKISEQINEIKATVSNEKIRELTEVVAEKLSIIKKSIGKIARGGESIGEQVSPDVIKAQIATNKFAKAATKLKNETQVKNQAVWDKVNDIDTTLKSYEKSSQQSTALLDKVA